MRRRAREPDPPRVRRAAGGRRRGHAGGAATVVAVAAWLAAAGCTRENPAYCDPERPCATGFVCQSDTHACVAADDCAAGGCLCAGPDECPSTTASCEDGLCVPCQPGEGGDAACAASDPARPTCSNGACVECLDSAVCIAVHGDDAPHCDVREASCGPCRDDAECGAGVCDEEAGRCLTVAELVHVAGDGVDGGPCTVAAPCASVAGALAVVTVDRATIVVAQGDQPYVETIALDGDAIDVPSVAVIGAVGGRPSFLASPDRPGVEASGGGAALRLERLELRDSNRAGVQCRAGADLRLVDVVVRGHDGIGVDAADGCALAIERSWIRGNRGGGVSVVDGDALRLVNDVIAGNGDSGDASRGGVVIEGASGTIEFCTIAENRIGLGERAPGVECLGDVALANNILWDNTHLGDRTQDNAGGTCTHASSIVGGALPTALDGGRVLDADPRFLAGTTFQLEAGSPAIDHADPTATLDVDIDGDARPAGAGRDVGAHERRP